MISRPAWRAAAVVLLLVPAATAIVVPRLGQAQATSAATDAVGKYVGRWNYDQPDRATMTNIATSNVPGRAQVPQIGDVVFTAEGPDRIVGRTDVGCTWRFKATATSLELDPANQLCRNPTSNIAYTLSRWSVVVAGARETEIIAAKSLHADGVYDFAVNKGARTRGTEYDLAAAANFTGTWTYDPADRDTGVNIRTTFRTAPEQSEERGQVMITRNYGNRITSRTGEGCTWTLVARGNTAKLDPAIQTCTLPTSSAITLRFWTIATDGRRQATVMNGTDERGGNFALAIGSLSKN